MNDLDLVRSMRADAPEPSQERLDEGRERLLSSVRPSSVWSSPARPSFGRLRSVLLAGGVAAATAAVAVTVQVGMRPDGAAGPPGPSPIPTPASTSTSAPTVGPIGDGGALIERASFGWLPAGLRPTGYSGDRQNPDEPFFTVTAQPTPTGGSVSLTTFEPGKPPGSRWPHKPGAPIPDRIPAKPVKGRMAYWVTKPGASGEGSSFILRWEYAPGGWAELEAYKLRGTTAEVTTMAYRIAESVKFGGTRPVPMPLRIKGVPDGVTPSLVDVSSGPNGRVRASLSFIVDEPDRMSIDIIESTGATQVGDLELPAPNTRLGRYSAYVRPDRLHVFGVNGFDVSVGASGSLLTRLNKTGGLTGLFQRTTVFGPDQSKWTADPVN